MNRLRQEWAKLWGNIENLESQFESWKKGLAIACVLEKNATKAIQNTTNYEQQFEGD